MITRPFAPSISRMAISVVLGGGRGTRLWPLTEYRAKPAVPLAGKYRLIDIPISNCLNSGLDRIYVLTQFMSSSLNRHVTSTYQLDPFSRGFVSIEVAHQSADSFDWYQGTADAVRRNWKEILQWRTPYVVILPGDTVFRMDLGQMLEFHREREADITVALHPVEARRASAFGIMQLDDGDRIVAMKEKPKKGEMPPPSCSPKQMEAWAMNEASPYLGSMGIYIFNSETLLQYLKHEDLTDFGHHILPAAVDKCRVHGYVFNDYWEDIGTIGAFFKSNLELARPKPPFSFYHPEAPIYTHIRFLPSTRMSRVEFHNTQIAEGCDIRDAVIDECMIGVRSVIRSGVKMRRVVMMGADFYEGGYTTPAWEPINPNDPKIGIADGTLIENAIIDKNARVGTNCKLVNKNGLETYDDPEGHYYIRDKVIIIPKHAVIQSGTEI